MLWQYYTVSLTSRSRRHRDHHRRTVLSRSSQQQLAVAPSAWTSGHRHSVRPSVPRPGRAPAGFGLPGARVVRYPGIVLRPGGSASVMCEAVPLPLPPGRRSRVTAARTARGAARARPLLLPLLRLMLAKCYLLRLLSLDAAPQRTAATKRLACSPACATTVLLTAVVRSGLRLEHLQSEGVEGGVVRYPRAACRGYHP
eukprot:COSAG01_NODE_19669_length_996_cov_1.907469_1_plen_199_part_00